MAITNFLKPLALSLLLLTQVHGAEPAQTAATEPHLSWESGLTKATGGVPASFAAVRDPDTNTVFQVRCLENGLVVFSLLAPHESSWKFEPHLYPVDNLEASLRVDNGQTFTHTPMAVKVDGGWEIFFQLRSSTDSLLTGMRSGQNLRVKLSESLPSPVGTRLFFARFPLEGARQAIGRAMDLVHMEHDNPNAGWFR